MDADFILIRKMKRGDDEAFDVFVHKYYAKIMQYCCYHCADPEYAKDLAQETFVRFFAKLSDYQHRGKVKNYLYTIAGNLCKDFYRKAKEIPLEAEAIIKESAAAEGPEEAVADRATIQWALSQLQEDLREVIILYYFQELKLAEIAGVLQIGLPLVKYRLRQARAKLQELMKKEDSLYEHR